MTILSMKDLALNTFTFVTVIGILEDVNSFKLIDSEGRDSLRITRLHFLLKVCSHTSFQN